MIISTMRAQTSLFIEPDIVSILARLQSSLTREDTRVFLVGGFIRDGLLKEVSYDIDLAVSGDAIQLARETADLVAGRFILLHENYQIARVVLTRNERRWHLDLATLRGSINEDLAKRDFTINAIAVDLSKLEAHLSLEDLIDPLNGIGDLQEKRIRATGDMIFREDPVRLLRALRLAAEYGFTIEPQTESLIERDGFLINNVSGERIREELGRILETDRATRSLREMDRLGLLDHLIPELTGCRGVTQPKEHYWNVFDHSIETVAAVERLLAELETREGFLASFNFCDELAGHLKQKAGSGMTRKALMKMAALLHDIAKPQTRSYDEGKERIRFLGHAQQGAAIAENVLERFRFSSREKEIVTRIIDQHLRPGHLSNAPQFPTPRAVYRYFRDNPDVGMDTLFISLADHLATRGPTVDNEGWQTHLRVTEHMLSQWLGEEGMASSPKLIDGNTLMDELGITPGPLVGKLLESVREAQAAGDVVTEKDALDLARKELDKTYANQR